MFPLSYIHRRGTGELNMDIKIAENIKKLREDNSLTQEAVAEALGVSEIAVYKWEAGRLPLEYKMIVRIAEFYDVPVDTITGGEKEEPGQIAVADLLPSNCRMCGGDLIHNYLAGTCKCANCGKGWTISDLYPGFSKYSTVITSIKKANDILDSRTVLASADEASLLLKQAILDCNRFNDEVSSDLVKLCNEGIEKADRLEIYCRGKHFYENKSYKSAINELEKVRGYRDSDKMIEQCKARLVTGNRSRIPQAIIFSMIVPAATGLALGVFAGWPVIVCILIFLAGSAGLGYLIYRGGVPSLVIKIVSIICIVPLLVLIGYSIVTLFTAAGLHGA